MIFKTENGIIQTGNRIISPTSRPLIKKSLLQHLLHINQGFKIGFQNRKWNYFTTSGPLIKKLLLQLLNNMNQRSSKLVYKTGNGIISPTSWPLIKKTSFTTFSPYYPRSSKLVFKTGNGIIQTEDGIISTNSGL